MKLMESSNEALHTIQNERKTHVEVAVVVEHRDSLAEVTSTQNETVGPDKEIMPQFSHNQT